jgi:hypothetical protein
MSWVMSPKVDTDPHIGFVLAAFEQAALARRPVKGLALVHHSDRGGQHLSIKHT